MEDRMEKISEIAETIDDYPLRIDPIYSHESPNDPIDLYEGELELQNDQKFYTGEGKIFFKWLPSPEVLLDAELYEPEYVEKLNPPSQYELSLNDRNIKAVVSITKTNYSSPSSRISVTGKVDGVLGLHSEVDLDETGTSYLLFHLPNFFNYIGRSIKESEFDSESPCKIPGTSSARMLLEGDNWSIKLDQENKYTDSLSELKAKGGYYLGHTGKISLKNQEIFTREKTDELIRTTTYFFSFLRGSWAGPVLVTGVNSEPVWTQLSNSLVSQWRVQRSWFPNLYISNIPLLFRNFEIKWKNDFWNEILRRYINFYVEANNPKLAIETGITLAQNALELLSWAYLIEEKELNKNDFNDTSEMIDELLRRLDIPNGIPNHQSEFSSVKSKLDPTDYNSKTGPDLLVSLRNMNVHPKKKKRKDMSRFSGEEKYWIRNLGVFYVELALLSLLDYEGPVYSRLKQGSPNNVSEEPPWIQAN